MKKYILLGVSLLIGISSWAKFDPPAKPKGMVLDEAGVFTLNEVTQLNRELIAFSDSTSNQIVVAVLNDFEGYEPFEVATSIGQEWGVGQGEFDNGVVVVIRPKTANQAGKVFIATGYGLEGAIPDGATKMIVEQEMIPLFKEDQMYAGVYNGVQVIKSLASEEYSFETYKKSKSDVSAVFPLLLLLAVFIFAMMRRVNNARGYSVGNDVGFWTALWMLNSSRGHGGHYNDFTSGGGGFGGGGFGGFGGGGFGGGGAGGSW